MQKLYDLSYSKFQFYKAILFLQHSKEKTERIKKEEEIKKLVCPRNSVFAIYIQRKAHSPIEKILFLENSRFGYLRKRTRGLYIFTCELLYYTQPRFNI